MQEDTLRAGAIWFQRARISALALLAGISSTACLTAPDAADIAEDGTIASNLTAGETALYKCAFPMCGGVALTFDSRDLLLRSCSYDARTNALECDMHASDSPAMPVEFWDDSSVQLTCAEKLQFSCTSRGDLQSCVCTAGEQSASRRKFQPIVIHKRID